MSKRHLNDLRDALQRNGWTVVESIGAWRLRRSGSKTLVLDSPLNRAYGVDVRGRAGGGLYFSRIGTKGSNRRVP